MIIVIILTIIIIIVIIHILITIAGMLIVRGTSTYIIISEQSLPEACATTTSYYMYVYDCYCLLMYRYIDS